MNTHSTQHSNLGIIYKKNKGSYEIRSNHQTISCGLANHLWKLLTGDLTIGDQVRFTSDANGSGTIIEALPRRNQLSRRSAAPMPSAHVAEQVIAANVDQVVPVFAAAQPAPKWNMLDRYLVTVETAGLPAIICITKTDLINGGEDAELMEAIADYRQIGYPVVLVSAKTGAGIEEIREAMQGRVSVLVGKSGVGKTSLLNALQPGLGQRIGAVNTITGKGRHTTTSLEMFPLNEDGAVIDTPGVREFGLWDVDPDDLAYGFPEMRPFLGRCRFGLDCQHDEEPGCAVRKAVMAGQISPRRYQSYQRLQLDR